MIPNAATRPLHSAPWLSFCYAAFLVSAGMMALGILWLPVDFATRGYLAMGALMLVQSTIVLTKTLRDVHEGSLLHRRIEDARVDELLARSDR